MTAASAARLACRRARTMRLYVDPATMTAAKCNYCTHRVDQGIEPACVVVCPVEAIVSGDLNDPNSRISQLDRGQRVQYPKVEKNTRPKLFYVGGETAAMDPAAAPPRADYVWSAGAAVNLKINGRTLSLADEEAQEEREPVAHTTRGKNLRFGDGRFRHTSPPRLLRRGFQSLRSSYMRLVRSAGRCRFGRRWFRRFSWD